MAAVDYFLKLGDIKGESSDDKHRDEIDILSFSWGESQSGSFSSGGGGGAGKVEFQDFQFTMLINAASVPLILACATGQHIPDGVLTARKSGGTQQTFYKVSFSDVLVSSFSEGGFAAGDTLPTDSFSINFAKIEWEYSRQKPDGTLDAPIRGGWDLKANTKF